MERICPSCAQPNPGAAVFCASCGRPFAAATERSSRCGSVCLIALLLLAGGVAVAYSVPSIRRSAQNVWARCVSSGESFDYRAEISLPDHKADAMFELLKPSDIAVKVGRRRDGVVVIGTKTEVQTLRRVAQSLTRYQGMSRSSMESCLRRDGYERRPADSFELPPEKRCALFHILAYDDVPILVSGGQGKIHVAASEDDCAIVHNVVEILRGKRLVEPCVASR